MTNPVRAFRLYLAALATLLLLPVPLSAWQQRVHYVMEIAMDVENHSYTGKQILIYYNNSPDTIREVYYHLFYEAFKPGSMMDARDRSLPGSWLRIDQLSHDQQGEVKLERLEQDGAPLEWKVSETILRAELERPLLPGDSTVLEMGWETRIPRLTRRGGWMSREGIDFSMSQWYPKLAEYDENGWHPDEYVGREFYGVYGTYDVAITIPANYMLGATGVLVNAYEIGAGYELGAVDTLLINPATGTGNKTWRFHAENVHDFAWVADRDYVHQISHWNGTEIHVLVTRQYYPIWRNAAIWTRMLMEYYSRRFGRYSWPQFTVAMAGDGGMEYPQLIMITGNRTQASLAGVIAHELGHQWYYGMIGNNETQEAWMDEGFTQYLTDEAARNLLRTQGFPNPYEGLDRIVYPWVQELPANTETAYELALNGYDEPLVTYHDRLREPITAGLVYYRGEAILRMVQYMFGDSLFDLAMRRYLEEWKFRHPSARDFERSLEKTSGMRLDWFFSQWVGTTKLCDYAIDAVGSEASAEGYRTTLRLSNRNEAIMPIDVTLYYEDGTRGMANIPVEEWRKPDADFHLPRWRWVDKSYSATFATPKPVVRAVIDTTLLLFDVDRTNNTARPGILGNAPPVDLAFYRRWDMNRPMTRYTARLRPTLWYSQADGPQIGFVADGGYAFNRYNTKIGGYYNVKSKRIDYDIRYNTKIGLIGRLGEISLLATNADGVQRWGGSIDKTIRPFFYQSSVSQKVSLRAEREVLVGPSYPNAVAPWTPGGYNTVGLAYSVGTSIASPSMALRGSAEFDASFASASEFTQWRLRGEARWNVWDMTVAGDLFVGASLGDPPAQRLFNVAGATSRDMHLNPVQRLGMNAHPDFMARNHLVLPTQGYLLSLAGLPPEERLGHNLVNMRVSIGDLNPFSRIVSVPVLRQIDLRLYGSGGWLFRDDLTLRGFSDYIVEAGVSAELDILQAFVPEVLIDMLDSPAPIRLGFHLPFYATSPTGILPKEGIGYRWAVGITM